MEPLAHTLVGAVLARTRLARSTPGALATCLVGANLPDLDGLCYFVGPDFALGHRRGWTHGVLALVVLPPLLAGAALAVDRWRRRHRGHGRAGRGGPPASPRAVLGLAALAVATHPALDFLNTYGVRFLFPFGGRWFYGDALFIVDPWIWLVLGGALLFGRRFGRERLAGAALAAVALYAGAMLAASAAGRRYVGAELGGAEPPPRILVAPEPANPFAWQVVADEGATLRFGRLTWPPARLVLGEPVPTLRDDPRVAAARASPAVRGMLGWLRIPFSVVEPAPGGGWTVWLLDARYARRPTTGFGGAAVRVDGDPPAP